MFIADSSSPYTARGIWCKGRRSTVQLRDLAATTEPDDLTATISVGDRVA